MTFTINLTIEAVDDLRTLRKFDQQIVLSAIDNQLSDQPHVVTRRRKRLRPNRLAEWELRVEDFRVFYDVNVAESQVKVVAVGQKRGERLFVHGEEYEL